MPAPLLIVTLIGLSLATIPPLAAGQRARLDGAADDGDYREYAFESLVENVRQWPDDPVDLSMQKPNYSTLIESPAAHRGDVYVVEGLVQQRTPLPPPYEDVEEWFVRTDSGLPIVIFVARRPQQQAIEDGTRIATAARFYKRMSFQARDGQRRAYAAFVSAEPRVLAKAESAPASSTKLWMIGGPIAVMLLVFAALLFYARRPASRRRPRSRIERALGASMEPPLDVSGDLPDDPAEALAELKRRAADR